MVMVVAWHFAHVSDRDSITADGLLSRHPDLGDGEQSGAEQMGSPAGVYVWERKPTPEQIALMGPAYDLWRVRAAGLPKDPDRLLDGAWRIGAPVTPDRLTLARVGRVPLPR